MKVETFDKLFTFLCLFQVAILIFAGLFVLEGYNDSKRSEKIKEVGVHFEIMDDFKDNINELYRGYYEGEYHGSLLLEREKIEISELLNKVNDISLEMDVVFGTTDDFDKVIQLSEDCWRAECFELREMLKEIGIGACSRACHERNASLLSYVFGDPSYDCYCSIGCEGARGHLW